MAISKPTKTVTFQTGAVVPWSGIYDVIHEAACEHANHQVTCIAKKDRFPPCRGCAHVEFKLSKAAKHISERKRFKSRKAA